MKRLTAGDTASLTYDVGASGDTYTAELTDALGRYLKVTTTTSDSNVIVTVSANSWPNGRSGHGRIQITNTATGSIVINERVRIMAGIGVERKGFSDYG